jgi:hypothetical protein
MCMDKALMTMPLLRCTLALALIPVPALIAADSAESKPPTTSSLQPIDKETHDAVKTLIKSLTSESYGEREMATKQLVEKDQAALPDLTATLAKCEDPEVCTRLRKIIASIQEVPFLGSFEQVSHEVEAGGGVRDEENENSGLSITKGKVTWQQDYQGHAMKQHYSFDDSKTSFKGEAEIKLKFIEMENGGPGYSPESNNPRLMLKNTSHGLQITFVATDGYNQTSTVQFSPGSGKKDEKKEEKKDEEKKEDE